MVEGSASGASVRPAVVMGVFPDGSGAERAYAALLDRGYTKEEIGVAMTDDTRKRLFTTTERTVQTVRGNMAAKGAGVGGAVGTALGSALASLLALGAPLVVPEFGVVVAGPAVAALAGAGAGGTTGGVIGGLIGAFVTEERVKEYALALKQGGVLLSVRPKSVEDAEALARGWEKGVNR